jgi:hypothetical protein
MRSACLIALFYSFSLNANFDAKDKWVLNVFDEGQNLTASGVIILTKIPAPSCLSGKWFAVKVTDIKTAENNRFPIETELSYQFTDENIVLGRNSRCDSYVHLTGQLSNDAISGVHSAFGLGWTRDLGTFKMSQVVL